MKKYEGYRVTFMHVQNVMKNANIEQAVITPDNKVYPCFFLTKPGFEIGYFDGNSIYITDPIEHDCLECISYNILNKKMKKRYYK